MQEVYDRPPQKRADRVALQHDALDIAAVLEHVRCHAAGGVDLFLGTTRAETDPALGHLLALDYEAYEPMALQQMTAIAAAARERFAIQQICMLHRLGRCAVGECSVAIAVAAAHRGPAFEACRFLIDTLKRDVPIWKKNCFERGDTFPAGHPLGSR